MIKYTKIIYKIEYDSEFTLAVFIICRGQYLKNVFALNVLFIYYKIL